MKGQNGLIGFILVVAVSIIFIGAMMPGISDQFLGTQDEVYYTNESTVTWNNSNMTYTLLHPPIVADTESIYNCTQPATTLVSGTDYTIDDTTGKISFINVTGVTQINETCSLPVTYNSSARGTYGNYTGATRTVGSIIPIMVIIVFALAILGGAGVKSKKK